MLRGVDGRPQTHRDLETLRSFAAGEHTDGWDGDDMKQVVVVSLDAVKYDVMHVHVAWQCPQKERWANT